MGLGLFGCSPAAKDPCAGLTYKDYGLSRQEYGGCARALVGSLDRMHEQLAILGDASQSKTRRTRARQACFAAGSTLARQMREAGGADKLVRIAWADEELSAFNRDIETVRSVYAMYCYYGLTGPDIVRIDPTHEQARAFAASLP